MGLRRCPLQTVSQPVRSPRGGHGCADPSKAVFFPQSAEKRDVLCAVGQNQVPHDDV
jgi:hypothetical protein